MSSFLVPLGPEEVPSPNTSRVTPCLRSLSDLPSFINEPYPQLSMLINPGATDLPEASIVFFASNCLDFPTYKIISSLIAIVPSEGLSPVPSYSKPL